MEGEPGDAGVRVYLAESNPRHLLAARHMTVRMKMLCSFHYYRDTDMDDLIAAFPTHPEVFGDSGAFSAMSVGAAIDVHEYGRWLQRWQHLLHVYVGLDVIGDPVASEENQRVLEDQYGLRPVPVFHGGEPWEYLHAYCARYPYVALGGMVSSAGPAAILRWLTHSFKIGEEYGTRFHGFGQTRIEVLKSIPFYSVDSSSWGSGHRYGQVHLWDDRRARWVRIKTGTRDALAHPQLVRAHGGDPVALSTPGFAQVGDSGKGVEQARDERAQIIAVNVAAWLLLERWLHRRHGYVSAPEGYTMGDGTRVYLADARGTRGHVTENPDLAIAEEQLDAGVRVYLADAATGGTNVPFHTLAEHLHGQAVEEQP